MRSARGYSLVELLVVVALLGGIVIGCARLMHEVTREAAAAERDGDAFASRWQAARRLRAEATRAASARVERGVLVLTSRDGSATRWQTCDGALVRGEVGADTTCDANAFRVDGALLTWLDGDRVTRVRVGGSR